MTALCCRDFHASLKWRTVFNFYLFSEVFFFLIACPFVPLKGSKIRAT